MQKLTGAGVIRSECQMTQWHAAAPDDVQSKLNFFVCIPIRRPALRAAMSLPTAAARLRLANKVSRRRSV